MKARFEEYYENGSIRKTGYRNEFGNIDGFVILYNEDGTEKEKLRYSNGMKIGNPFENKSASEVLDKIGGNVEEIDPFENEIADTEIMIDSKFASTLLMGDKYYGK